MDYPTNHNLFHSDQPLVQVSQSRLYLPRRRHLITTVAVTLVIAFLMAAMVANIRQPEATPAPLRVHTDCSGFVSKGE